MNLNSKEIRRAEHEYMNIHPPPINALVTPLRPETANGTKTAEPTGSNSGTTNV
jgi:hypothetical protein